MSGLVTGLQNRAQRFESASDLQNSIANQLFFGWLAFFIQNRVCLLESHCCQVAIRYKELVS